MNDTKESFVFEKKNYATIAIGFALVILGFLLMSGGKSDDPNIFRGEEVFSSTRITIAPFTVLIGFIVVGFGIMLKPKTDKNNPTVYKD
jgi:uncharacterized membrane protein